VISDEYGVAKRSAMRWRKVAIGDTLERPQLFQTDGTKIPRFQRPRLSPKASRWHRNEPCAWSRRLSARGIDDTDWRQLGMLPPASKRAVRAIRFARSRDRRLLFAEEFLGCHFSQQGKGFLAAKSSG